MEFRCPSPLFSSRASAAFVPLLSSEAGPSGVRAIRREVVEAAYAEYLRQYGNQQSFESLHERGGFSIEELLSLLTEAASRTSGG